MTLEEIKNKSLYRNNQSSHIVKIVDIFDKTITYKDLHSKYLHVTDFEMFLSNFERYI